MFSRRVSGLRVLKESPEKEIAGIKFKNYGSHSDNYSHLPFFTVAAAIGVKQKEIDLFLKRLDDALSKIHKNEIKQFNKIALINAILGFYIIEDFIIV